MSFDLNKCPIIDDSNASQYAGMIMDGVMSSGYEARDYSQFSMGSVAPVYNGKRFSRREWPDMIKRQDDNHTSPWHHHKAAKAPILDQNGFPYCWMFGTVAGIMTGYAKQGLPGPHLSATAPAAQGKNYRKEGGWAGEALKYIKQFGLPTIQTWPEHSLDRRHANNHEQQLDAQRHGVVEFLELEQQDFEMAMSILLDPDNPCPVTMGLMWWGHLVCGLKAVQLSRNEFGIVIVNSWSENWENGGFAVLSESKATAHEYIAIQSVSPRAA
jgi:hypothetical protein